MWCTRYLAIIRLWRNAWAEFIPFLDYGACCRMRVLVVFVRVVARAWLMAKEFRPVRRDQVFLMPPDMREWLPSDHLVWFILDTLEALDLTGLEATRRRGGVGAAGYDPRMLLGLLMYGYCRGVRSSRQIERRHRRRVPGVVCPRRPGPLHPGPVPRGLPGRIHLAVHAGADDRRACRLGPVRDRSDRWHQDRGERLDRRQPGPGVARAGGEPDGHRRRTGRRPRGCAVGPRSPTCRG
jgi:hypothetical protein